MTPQGILGYPVPPPPLGVPWEIPWGTFAWGIPRGIPMRGGIAWGAPILGGSPLGIVLGITCWDPMGTSGGILGPTRAAGGIYIWGTPRGLPMGNPLGDSRRGSRHVKMIKVKKRKD